ncbi:hypothetical protein CR513_37247, partial [Mucuna pruriens]
MYFNGASNRFMPHIIRDREDSNTGSSHINLGIQYSTIWETAIPARPTKRTICSLESRIHAKCTLWSSWLPTANFTISSTFLPATATENSYSRKLTINGRFDEAASNKQPRISTISKFQQHEILAKHDRHHPGSQDANRTASKHYE